MLANDSDIFADLAPLPEIQVSSDQDLHSHYDRKEPFIVRGLVKDWPLVKAGEVSGEAARRYLLDKAVNRPFVATVGPKDADGRIFYDDDMHVNTVTRRASLPVIFQKMAEAEALENPAIIYLGSVVIREFFKGLHEETPMNLPVGEPHGRIWIGTKSRIAAHNDYSDNLACVAVGRRRFTVFPPEEYKNLYMGPMENTPAGRAISMVDFHNPDFDLHPKFKAALKAGKTATLNAGDAIFIPAMWWHHVEGLMDFNVLVNFWWKEAPHHFGAAQNVLNHAMMSIRDLPAHEKAHWKSLFDHYIFDNSPDVTDHLPEIGRGILGPMTPDNASKIRNFLIKMLNEEKSE